MYHLEPLPFFPAEMFVISRISSIADGKSGKIRPGDGMTGLKKMIGLPVILDGKASGSVLRGVLERDGRTLRGVVIRSGLTGARWLPKGSIDLLGQFSLIGRGKPEKVPKDASYRLFRVTDPEGDRIGIVTDVLLNEKTLRVAALEISSGPLDDLIDGRWYAASFYVRPAGETGHVTLVRPREEERNAWENS